MAVRLEERDQRRLAEEAQLEQGIATPLHHGADIALED